MLVLVTGSACVKDGGGDDVARLERVRSELVAAIGLEPLPGESTPGAGSIKSKAAPLYVTATGRVPGTAEVAVDALPAAMSRAGFVSVAPAQPRRGVVAGVRDDLVVEISVYEELGSLHDEPGTAYVQLQLGPRDSALAWTLVQR